MRRSAFALLLCFSLLTAAPSSQDPAAPDAAEAGSVDAIRSATGDPKFLSPLVSYLPRVDGVPSPLAFFKRIMGAPGELVNTTQAYAYCRALAAASPRVRVFTIGRSEEGREILMLAIADEAGIRELDRLKTVTSTLADPRRIDPAAASRLAETGRPIYYFNAALHSDETGSTEATLELAYRLAVSKQPAIERIRQRLVVLINPVSNPDGRDKVVDWFYTYLKGKTDFALLPRQSPPYWSKYTFVDINRDTHQQTHEATKAVHRMFHEWHPTVVHDLHEGSPLMLTWNGTGPYNPNIDSITYDEFLELSFHEVQAMTAAGMPGVSTWNFGEAFSHLYLDSVAMNHNSIGRGYETWGNGSAETMRRTVGPARRTPRWYNLEPPPAEVVWSARDNINYQETGALVVLDFAARHAPEMLQNFYRKGWNSWQKGITGPPYAFLIPADQGDPARVAQMVARLIGQHIEVARATADIRLSDASLPAGTYVVRLDQPYRNYAVDLLTRQDYPKDGGEPYDDISWELPAHYHLDVRPTADPAVRTAAVAPVGDPPHAEGRVVGTGPVLLVRDTGQEALLEARYRLAPFTVKIAEAAFKTAGVSYPAGSWILAPRMALRTPRAPRRPISGSNSLPRQPRPTCATHDAKPPRIGVWVPWADTDSIGWIRYILDQRHVPYVYLRDEDVRAGALASRIDVLLYGHVDLELAEQIQGLPKAWGPMPFKKTAATPASERPRNPTTSPAASDGRDLRRSSKFIEGGGLMVTLGSGSMLPLEGGIVRGVRRAAGGVPRLSGGNGANALDDAETRTPGSHVRVTFTRPDHPLAYGYPAETHVFRQNFPLYDVPRRWLRMAYCTTCLDGPFDRSAIVLQWGSVAGAPFVVSGQAWGEGRLLGRPAILDVPVGRGHVVAFNFNPMHRDLNRGDHRMVWNALLNWQAIVAQQR